MVKQRGFAAVLIACKRKREECPFGERIFRRPFVIASAFAKTWVFALLIVIAIVCGLRRLFLLFDIWLADFNLVCVSKAQSELIAVYEQLNRVTHRCVFDERNLNTLYHAHVKEVLTERAFAADGLYDGTFAYFHVLYCHILPSYYHNNISFFLAMSTKYEKYFTFISTTFALCPFLCANYLLIIYLPYDKIKI